MEKANTNPLEAIGFELALLGSTYSTLDRDGKAKAEQRYNELLAELTELDDIDNEVDRHTS